MWQLITCHMPLASSPFLLAIYLFQGLIKRVIGFDNTGQVFVNLSGRQITCAFITTRTIWHMIRLAYISQMIPILLFIILK